MVRLFLSIFFFHSLGFSCLAQVQVGQWRDHFCLKNIDNIVVHNNIVYGSSSLGLIEYDLSDNSVQKRTKANGLSDIGLTSLAVDNIGNIMIGYSNGNIDIVSDDRVVNMRDLLDKSMQGTKTINNIIINNGKAYLSCDLGILVVNISKSEVAQTFILSDSPLPNKVCKVLIHNDTIYAATSRGIYSSALANPRIQIFSSWSQFSMDKSYYSDIVYFNSCFIVAKGEKSKPCTIQSSKKGVISILSSVPNFIGLSSDDRLFITDKSSISIFDSSFSLVKTIYPTGSLFSASAVKVGGGFFTGVIDVGLRFFTDFINAESYNDVIVNGPNSNSVSAVAANNYGVWFSPGGIDSKWNNLFIPVFYSFFDGLSWSSYTSKQFPVFSSEIDLFQIALNPKSPKDVTFSSWGSGIFQVINNDSVTHYDQHNSILRNIFQEDNNYVRVGGIVIDKNGNTWMTNSGSPEGGIVVKTVDNRWFCYDYETSKSMHSQGQILVAKNGFKWSYFPRTEHIGLFIWDDNGTVDNTSDDKYRGSAEVNKESDVRNSGQIEIWNRSGDVITNVINCIVEDNEGLIWLGTDKGPVVYYHPNSIFTDAKPIATQINIPRNDGSGLGDYLLGTEVIIAMAVDGANRKWIGTATSGIYLISEDGTNQIEHFTVDNSPLPSDNITSISIQPGSGEVFIGTTSGLVSYRGTASSSFSDNSAPIVFPNPVRSNFTGLVTIKGTVAESNVKITDVSGILVNEMKSLGGQAVWDRRNFNGELVKSGVYFIFITNSDGTLSGKTKVMIIN